MTALTARRYILRVKLVWAIVLFLAAIGVGAAVNRALFVDDAVTREDPVRQRILDRLGIEDPHLRDRPAELRRIDGRFAAHPFLTLGHVVPGAAFLALAPLQFYAPLRNRYRTVHRWAFLHTDHHLRQFGL